jgi:hypothetical protein
MHLPHYSTNRVLDQNHITLLILTSCRVLVAITTVLGSAAPVVAAPLISRGSVVCILSSCCADGEGQWRADVALERRLSPAEA